MKYHVRDSRYPSILIKEIEMKDYNLISKFKEDFSVLDGIISSFANYKNAFIGFKEFKASIESEINKVHLEDIQRLSVYPITVLIIFIATFINNAMYCKDKINSDKLTNELTRINSTISFKVLRALRNYTIHTSIPVKRSKRIHDLMKDERKYEFFVQKEDIMERANKNDIKLLNEISSDNIVFEPLFQDTQKELENLLVLILEEFIKSISTEVKQSLLKNIKHYKDKDSNQLFANSIVISEPTKYGKGLTAKEIIHFDSVVLEAVMSTLTSFDSEPLAY